MKSKFLLLLPFTLVAIAVSLSCKAHAQQASEPKVVAPFDSLLLKDISSSGNPQTGNLTITMQFQNRFPGEARVHLKLGAFEDFGLTDDKGNKYKFFTSENLHGAAGINKGYGKVSAVELGGKKSSSFMYVQQSIPSGKGMVLTIRLAGVDKTVTKITSLHMRCRLTVEGKMMGERLYQVENIPVEWTDGQKEDAVMI